MTTRATAAAVITRVRRLTTTDQAPLKTLVTDEEIQEALDRYRIELRQYPLLPLDEIEAGTGRVLWRIFVSPFEWLESPLLQSGNLWQVLTPTESDLTNGRFTLAEHHVAGVYLTGWSHDPFVAAADVLEELAAQRILTVDFGAANVSVSRSQVRTNMLQQARTYRERGRIIYASLLRTDAGV